MSIGNSDVNYLTGELGVELDYSTRTEEMSFQTEL